MKKLDLTYNELMLGFQPALFSIGSLTIKDLSVVIKVSKAQKAAKEVAESYSEMHKKISEQSCLKDQNGQPVVVMKDGQQVYDHPSDKERDETIKLLQELISKKVTIEVDPINAEDLDKIEGLTANTLSALGEFISYG